MKTLVLLFLTPFPLALAAGGGAILFGWPMLTLMQRLLIAAGTRTGRPADFRTFRRRLGRYSLVPAALPLLALLVPSARDAGWPAGGLLLVWALATVAVWHFNARRLHREWDAGLPY